MKQPGQPARLCGIWFQIGLCRVSLGGPCFDMARVHVGSQDNNLYAISARTGVLIWKYSGAGAFRIARSI
jgi:outer membrane protein assembly factor BamB